MTLSLGLGNQHPELFVRGGHKGLNQSLGLSQPMVSVVSTGASRCFTFIHWGAYSPDPLALLHFYLLGSVLPRPLGAASLLFTGERTPQTPWRCFTFVHWGAYSPDPLAPSGASRQSDRWFRQARGPQEAQGGFDKLGDRRRRKVVSTSSGTAGGARWFRQARGPQEAQGGFDRLNHRIPPRQRTK